MTSQEWRLLRGIIPKWPYFRYIYIHISQHISHRGEFSPFSLVGSRDCGILSLQNKNKFHFCILSARRATQAEGVLEKMPCRSSEVENQVENQVVLRLCSSLTSVRSFTGSSDRWSTCPGSFGSGLPGAWVLRTVGTPTGPCHVSTVATQTGRSSQDVWHVWESGGFMVLSKDQPFSEWSWIELVEVDNGKVLKVFRLLLRGQALQCIEMDAFPI